MVYNRQKKLKNLVREVWPNSLKNKTSLGFFLFELPAKISSCFCEHFNSLTLSEELSGLFAHFRAFSSLTTNLSRCLFFLNYSLQSSSMAFIFSMNYISHCPGFFYVSVHIIEPTSLSLKIDVYCITGKPLGATTRNYCTLRKLLIMTETTRFIVRLIKSTMFKWACGLKNGI